jgi:predicted ester cyclase
VSTTTVETYLNFLSELYADDLYADGLYAESNKDFCRRFIETIFNQGELSLICDFMSPSAVIHEIADALGDCQEHSIEWMTDLTLLYRHAFPDLRFEIQDQLAEDDRVVTFLRMRGTHKNALMSIAASGRKIDIAGIRVDRVVGGKIVESWFHLDALGMLRQLHALPALNRRPRKVAPVSHKATAGAKPVVGWNPVPALAG